MVPLFTRVGQGSLVNAGFPHTVSITFVRVVLSKTAPLHLTHPGPCVRLAYDGTGLVIVSKRLEKGVFSRINSL